jgi:hypothetical protein
LKTIPVVLIAALVWLIPSARAQQQPDLNLVSPALPAAAPASYGSSETSMFFPHDWLRGHLDFEVAAPHNEPDLGRCSELPAAQFGGANSACTAFARWVMSGYVEVQPFGRTPLRHLYVFYTPQLFFGRNVPQYVYTASFAPIVAEQSFGFGYELPKNLELRLTMHRADWLGRYRNYLGPADLGSEGPYGNFATVGVRWNFGGWGRAHDE